MTAVAPVADPPAARGPAELPVVDRTERHLVIGAGFAGLGVAAALRRDGIALDQVDASDAIGGNWYHGVYESAHIISSKKTTEYADYPMPASYPDFPSAAQMLAYLRAYAAHAGIDRDVELRTAVEHLAPEGDGARWRATVRLPDGRREVRRYAGVVACNGHHWDRRMPRWPGRFEGTILHSKDYTSRRQLEGKRVLVVGSGNSACDVAVEASRVGRSSTISVRRGAWIMPKHLMGVPTVELLRPWMLPFVQRAMARVLVAIAVGDYATYGLPRPPDRPFDRHPTINSDLLDGLKHGRITARPDLERLDGHTAHFVDGTRLEVDLVVCATGFHLSFPFLDEGILDRVGDLPALVGGVLPTRHRNLYLFGTSQPRYGAGPLITRGAELVATMIRTQARLRRPLGALLRRLGAPIMTNQVQDPFDALRRIRLSKALVPRLPLLEALPSMGSTLVARTEAEVDAGA